MKRSDLEALKNDLVYAKRRGWIEVANEGGQQIIDRIKELLEELINNNYGN